MMSIDEPGSIPDLDALVSRLEQLPNVTGGGLHEPLFAGQELNYVNECIQSGFVSSVGSFVSRFEEELARYVGAKHAVATVNGTSALHLALVAVGVQPGDEVIVPALSFVATASAVVLAGARPHFVDVSSLTWGIDPAGLRHHLTEAFTWDGQNLVNGVTGSKVTAVVAMHALGHPCDAEGIKAVADEFGIALIEDAAESLGSYSGTVHTGLAGQAGIFSFNGNKTITTGGGGALVTNHPELAVRAKHLSTTAKVDHPFEFNHDAIGYNYRMPNINAALGVAQLEQLPDLIRRQRSLHRLYHGLLSELAFGSVRTETPGTSSNYWLHAFVLDEASPALRDRILDKCIVAGIPVRPLWKPLNTLVPYSDFPSSPTPVATDLYSRVICLPSSAALVR